MESKTTFQELESAPVFKEKLSIDELRKILTSQMEAATCCVCMEALQSSVVVCVQGHGVCRPCHQRLSHCPICKAEFSSCKQTLLGNILDTLPHDCPNKGCSHFVKAGDDHEAWCGYSRTKCCRCDWIGCGKDILSHVKDQHPKLYIFKEKNHCHLVDFNPDDHIRDFAPFFALGHFFWAECSVDYKAQTLDMRYHLVRNGKIDKPIVVVLQMKSKFLHTTYRLRLNLSSRVQPADNCISVSLAMVQNFVDHKKNLPYQVDFVQSTSDS